MNKNSIKLLLRKYPSFLRHLQYINCLVFNRNRILQKKKFGILNSEKTVFVIRPNSNDGVQGLMSLFIQTMRWINYSNECQYVPYIDFKNYETQYYNGIDNIWEYYFTQPSAITYHEVYSSSNVILSGCTWKKNVDLELYSGEIFKNDQLCEKCFKIIWDNIDLSDEVKEIVCRENENIHVEDCIGIYIRGTDYVKLKPTGEYVQPAIDEVIKKINEFTQKHGNKDIFLVTEDDSYYQILLKEFGNRIKLVSFDSFIQNYDGSTFLSKSNVLNPDRKKRGMDYLVKIVLLSKCKYLISSITMGSIAAYCLNGNHYEDKYIFDLGLYS